MMRARRVAFFADSFHDVNGVALTSRQFEAFARRRQLPFFSLHAGPVHRVEHEGSVTVYEIQRSAAAFNLEANSELCFDPLIPRYRNQILEALTVFQPDVLHVTGPCDIGMLGAWLAHKLSIPLAASWHTNVHEYASRRLEKLLSFMPESARKGVSEAAEKGAFTGAARFYKLAKILFAPNQELVDLLNASTDKPCFIMHRGVDAELYTPVRRSAGAVPFTIGYVGRLSVEKNVAFLAKLEQSLIAAGKTDYRFVIIGPGSQTEWLRDNMRRVELPGVLHGETLANAYADMDVFAFPSYTDTFGNVILESLASGVPAVVTNGGGPKYLVQDGVTGFVAASEDEFTGAVLRLMDNSALHASMRAAAREYACSISWDRVFEQVYESYEEVLFREEAALPAAC